MDSGNSGSMNSSSGGDDHDFDSRATAESISALFNPPHTQIPNTNPSFSFDPQQSNFFNNPFVSLNSSSSGWSDPNHSGFDPSQSLPVSLPVPPQTVAQTTTPAARNPKKRSRASRRAPTTVLTTDTTNFRAMVQEFTGIPASPFMSSSASSGPFIRSKLDDFFRVPSSIRSNLSPHQPQPQLPNYQLLKPFPQKLQQPPPFLSSSSFQSLLQSDPKYNPLPPSSSGLVGSKPLQNEPDETILKTGLLNEFGFSQPEITGGDTNYGSSLQGFSDGRLSFLGSSSSSSNYQTAKGPENVAARGEGMVESWICSSE